MAEKRTTSDDSGEAPDTSQTTYATLRSLIVTGKLAPGSRVLETDVADRLGVSRTPARYALNRLHREGFVRSDGAGKRSRFTVTPLTREDGRELLLVVGQLEALAAWLVAHLEDGERETVADEMEAVNRELRAEASAEQPDPERIFTLDQSFHRLVVQRAETERLETLHDYYKPQTDRYLRVYLTALTDRIDQSVIEHTAIIEAIRAGGPEEAEKAMRTNWRHAAHQLDDVISAIGELGNW